MTRGPAHGTEHWAEMPAKSPPLLCELHAHTTLRDGSLTIRELCDLYGRRGFDVLAVTDHAPLEARHVQAATFAAYLENVEEEAVRARWLYDLLVVPGLELTFDDPDPLRAPTSWPSGYASTST